MQPSDTAITDLTINSSRVEFGSAKLHRTDTTLSTGLLGSPDWQIELLHGHLPGNAEDVRVELTADGVSYTGAGRVEDRDNGTDNRTVIRANGPLISYTRAH